MSMNIDDLVAAIDLNEKRLKVLVGQRNRVSDQISTVEGSLRFFRAQLPQAEIPAVGSNVKEKK